MAIYDDKTGVTLLDAQVPFVTGVLPPSLERRYMNPLRYRVNYRIVPCYVLFCALCLVAGIVLMGMDDERFMPVFIGLLAAIGAASTWLLMTVPKTRKKELRLELERYDFDVSSVPERDRYEIEYEGSKLVFDANGVKVDEKFYWYGHLNPGLVTSNRFNRVWVAIMFGEDPEKSLFVPVSPTLIRAVESLNIPLQNREMFNYLLQYKENAFAQIYKYGTFQVFQYD